jgi:competence protein ComEC
MIFMRRKLCALLALLLILSGCRINNSEISTTKEPFITKAASSTSPIETDTAESTNSEITLASMETVETEFPTESQAAATPLDVHFLDVGQADSIFIKTHEGKTMLIDGGNTADGDFVTSYIKDQGITKLDIIIGTHPHEDHIGGLDKVIRLLNVEKIYMPKVMHTSQAFEDVLDAIGTKGLKVTTPVVGDTFDLGSIKCTIVAPNSEKYDDFNNYSIVLKMEYGQTSFLFTGDAETVSEQEMLTGKYDLKADVLKVGHHGSTSSTSLAFLKAVSPKYAVISAGKDNQYGHPDSIILNRLKTFGTEIYRTDESGTIIAISDGKSITFDKKASPVKENAPPANVESSQSSASLQDNTVYVTKTGAKYHNDGCRYLSKSKIPIDLSEAIASGYTPCSVCNPPASSDSSVQKDIITKEGSKQASSNAAEEKEVIVYITKTGEKYHSAGCSYLKKSKIPIELSDAKNSGYTPCSRCNPPR